MQAKCFSVFVSIVRLISFSVASDLCQTFVWVQEIKDVPCGSFGRRKEKKEAMSCLGMK